MSVIAIIGDIHLGKGLLIGKPGIGSALNSRIMDQINLLNWILEQSIEHNVEVMIFTGDIFDSVNPNYRLVSFFIEYIKTCEYNNIEVHIAIGNHDIKRTGGVATSVLDIITFAELPMTFIYKNIKTIYFDGIGVTIIPFRDRLFLDCSTNDQAIDLLKNQLPYQSSLIPDDYDKLLIGHLGLEGAIYFGDEYDNKSNELMCPAQMFKDYDYTWMGHIHKPQVMSEKPYVAHIGSIDISDFGETDQIKHIVIYNSNKIDKFKYIQLPTRTLKHIDIDVPINTDNTTQFVIDELDKQNKIKSVANAIIRIKVVLPDTELESIDRSAVEDFIYNKLKAFYICSLSESRSVSVVSIDKKNLVDNKVMPNEAVKLFATQEDFDSEKERERYITEASVIIDEYYDS